VSICDGVRGQIFSKGGGGLSLEPAHRHVRSEAAPSAGKRGTDGPLASSVLAFRREDEREVGRCKLNPVDRDARFQPLNLEV
jgi:hypothetical protein